MLTDPLVCANVVLLCDVPALVTITAGGQGLGVMIVAVNHTWAKHGVTHLLYVNQVRRGAGLPRVLIVNTGVPLS